MSWLTGPTGLQRGPAYESAASCKPNEEDEEEEVEDDDEEEEEE